MAAKKVLLIEDESDIRELIHFHLFKEKYDVILAEDGVEGLSLARSESPDLILLDLMLPKKDGVTVCKELRESESTKSIPIIMITAKATEDDVIHGLDQGADDYITKPFSPKVLLARVRNQLKNSKDKNQKEESIQIHGLNIDSQMRKISTPKEEIEVTFGQFQIVYLLAKNPGQVFTRAKIVELVRGENHAITDRSVDVQIVLLRKKLGEYGKLIETVRGAGYRFKEIRN